jgi:hypothetical protein
MLPSLPPRVIGRSGSAPEGMILLGITRATMSPSTAPLVITKGDSLLFLRHGYAWKVTPTHQSWQVNPWKDGDLVIDEPFEREAFPFGAEPWQT